ncbi:uncharacterized protein Tco025E_01358 [Trypanosoma conorhini]|uniref:Uncharacterized protein n=1 Tax=Trypanosoma conorhini TaxID=83891 RepID=A0A3S5IUL4_9TRYP|nr:uncharacterized protein Tco025E_01358 [Trypanosoma conorhini]RNF26588.1 hypothetical protein Tco025E_01358 [Trypanosoma conorhini]
MTRQCWRPPPRQRTWLDQVQQCISYRPPAGCRSADGGRKRERREALPVHAVLPGKREGQHCLHAEAPARDAHSIPHTATRRLRSGVDLVVLHTHGLGKLHERLHFVLAALRCPHHTHGVPTRRKTQRHASRWRQISTILYFSFIQQGAQLRPQLLVCYLSKTKIA